MTTEHRDGPESHAALIYLLNCYDVWSATPPRPRHCLALGPALAPAAPGAREDTP